VAELLEQLKARDPGAQQQLRSELFGKIAATCTRLLGDPVKAESVAEDLWMDFLFTHIDKVREPRAISAYLRMMTVRRCLRLREFEAKHLDLEGGREPATDPEAELLSAIDQPRLQERLTRCLQKLDGRARWMLRLRFFEEQKLEEIGEQASVSKQYAGRVVKQSLGRLRKCMGVRA